MIGNVGEWTWHPQGTEDITVSPPVALRDHAHEELAASELAGIGDDKAEQVLEERVEYGMLIEPMETKVFHRIENFAAATSVCCGKRVFGFLLPWPFVEDRYRVRIATIARERVAIEAHVFGRHAFGECRGDGAPITAVQNTIAIGIGIWIEIGPRGGG